jgi:hypothetical protein
VRNAVGVRLSREACQREVIRRLENFDFTHTTRQELLKELAELDPEHPLLCSLHEARAAGGPSLGYSRNSSGNYAMFAPCCSGCRIGKADRASAEL